MKKKKPKNVYVHSIDLIEIRIENKAPEEFAKEVINIPYRGYTVEKLHNGNSVVITKPGGKSAFGKMKKEDIQVFLFENSSNSLWQVTHDQIKQAVREIGNRNPKHGIKLLKLLELVYNGTEPEDLVAEIDFEGTESLSPEAILKLNKWIWVQEDVNYPPPLLGRRKVWLGISDDGTNSGDGYKDILNEFTSKFL